jgi:hypothetical protein
LGSIDPGNDPEYGCISIQEPLENGVELDIYYDPGTVSELLKSAQMGIVVNLPLKRISGLAIAFIWTVCR